MAAKILVVDDDPNVQRLLQYTLKQEGYEVVVAADGAEGFQLLGARKSPALILLDVMLPKLDGYQVAAKIRAEEGAGVARPDHHAHRRGGGGAEGPGPPGRCRRLPDQAVPPGRAAGPDEEPPRALRAHATSLVGRPPLGRILAFYGAKGGVGTTTIAINAAIALHRELGRQVCLVDGNLQFGDHRVFLDLGLDRKSIVDVVSAPVDRRRPPARRPRQSTTRGSTCCSRRPRRRRPSSSPRTHLRHDPRAAAGHVRLRRRRHRQAPRRHEPAASSTWPTRSSWS